MKKVICISGKAQHGKDTVGSITSDILKEKGFKTIIIHYADLLKYICKTYFNWDGNKDDKGRTLLQYVGTDTVRTKDPDYWVDFVISFLHLFEDEWDYVIIPDCRFPNEIDKISDNFSYVHWSVFRPGFDNKLTEEQKQHPSETSLDKYLPDELIINYGTYEGLNKKISELVNDLLNNTD